VALADAEGRVLARELVAGLDLPPWPNSAMDGYARLADWQGEALPVSQRIFAGHAPQPLQPGTCARIFTGAPVPEGADCVEMQENAEVLEDGRVRFLEPLAVDQNVRPKGQETRAGEQVMSAGTRLGPIQLGLAATLGFARLDVVRRPRWRCCPPATNWSSPACRWARADLQQQPAPAGQLVAAPGL
jgi:molybdopterin molybdotransferase